MTIHFRDIPRRITGFSTPIFGVSWQAPPDDRVAVRRLIIFLEDRRALFNLYDREVEEAVRLSVEMIRQEITRTMQEVSEGAKALPWLRGMQAACHQFLDDCQDSTRQEDLDELLFLPSHRPMNASPTFYTALGALRASVGLHIAHLCALYGIDVEGNLTQILPPEQD